LAGQLRPASPPRLRWFAVMVILLYPEINEMRYFLIRDFAFWAFALWSLSLLVDYSANARLGSAIGWCLCVLLATAFRLEGLLLLALAPLALSLPQRNQDNPLRRIWPLWAVLAVGVALVVLGCSLAGI